MAYYQHEKTGEVVKWSPDYHESRKDKDRYKYVGFAKRRLALKETKSTKKRGSK